MPWPLNGALCALNRVCLSHSTLGPLHKIQLRVTRLDDIAGETSARWFGGVLKPQIAIASTFKLKSGVRAMQLKRLRHEQSRYLHFVTFNQSAHRESGQGISASASISSHLQRLTQGSEVTFSELNVNITTDISGASR